RIEAMWHTLCRVAALTLASVTFAEAANAMPVAVTIAAEPAAARRPTLAAQHCWRRHGQLHCPQWRRPDGGGFGYDGEYYVFDANKLPFGTMRWRDQMRRENRLGNPG